jgi:hypothetical protein
MQSARKPPQSDPRAGAERARLCAWLRGEPSAWNSLDDFDCEDFFFASRYHGLTPLLYQQVNQAADRQSCPAGVQLRLKQASAGTAAQELIRRAALQSLLDALAQRGVRGLLLKGTALAYTLYPSASLRCRGDTDLLIREPDVAAAREIFAALGYQSGDALADDRIHAQACYYRNDDYGVEHCVDLHWRSSNTYIFRDTFDFDELWDASIAIAALSKHGRGLGAAHALLLACVHRLTHLQAPYYVDGAAYYDSDRLIWLYDIHLLAQSMSAAQWRRLFEIARDKGLTEICVDGLLAARGALGTELPAAAMEPPSLQGSAAAAAVADFALPRWRWELLALRAAPSWRARAKLLAANLFPRVDYMQARFRISQRYHLPLYYFRRVIEGAWKRR